MDGSIEAHQKRYRKNTGRASKSHHSDNQIQAIQYENVALQAEKDVYQPMLQKCQDTIIKLKTCYVDHARDPDKGNIVLIIEKNTTPGEEKFYEYPYYIVSIQ